MSNLEDNVDAEIENNFVASSNPNTTVEFWNADETKFLVEKFNEYIGEVRSRDNLNARFPTKRRMFEQISFELNEKFNTNRSFEQCQNRYKTIQRKRSKKYMTSTEYEDLMPEVNNDDADYETVYLNGDHVKMEMDLEAPVEDEIDEEYGDDEKNNTDDDDHDAMPSKRPKLDHINEMHSTIQSGKSQRNTSNSGALLIRDTLLEIYRMKEANKERRHQEMVAIWKTFLSTQK